MINQLVYWVACFFFIDSITNGSSERKYLVTARVITGQEVIGTGFCWDRSSALSLVGSEITQS